MKHTNVLLLYIVNLAVIFLLALALYQTSTEPTTRLNLPLVAIIAVLGMVSTTIAFFHLLKLANLRDFVAKDTNSEDISDYVMEYFVGAKTGIMLTRTQHCETGETVYVLHSKFHNKSKEVLQYAVKSKIKGLTEFVYPHEILVEGETVNPNPAKVIPLN